MAEYVVTFNKIDDFTGLRRMSLEEASRVLAIAERGLKHGRIVQIPEQEPINVQTEEA